MRRFPRLCALALLFVALSVDPAASAPPASRTGSAKEVADLAQRIESAQDPLPAIDALAALEGSEATRSLGALLVSGLPDASADRILAKLVDKPRPAALDALETMAHHRRAEARVLALRAIAAVGFEYEKLATSTSKLLATGLRDSDPRVRGAAAAALGQRAERRERDPRAPQLHEGAVDVLLQAVARGVPEAARAAGLAVPEAALPLLHEALRGQPMTATLDAYDAALARKSLSEASKLDILARLGEIATPASKTFLATLISKNRFPLNSTLQRALIETEKRIVVRPAASGGAP